MNSTQRKFLLQIWNHLNSLGCEIGSEPHLHPDFHGHAESLRQLFPKLLATYIDDDNIDSESFLLTLTSRREILAGHGLSDLLGQGLEALAKRTSITFLD